MLPWVDFKPVLFSLSVAPPASLVFALFESIEKRSLLEFYPLSPHQLLFFAAVLLSMVRRTPQSSLLPPFVVASSSALFSYTSQVTCGKRAPVSLIDLPRVQRTSFWPGFSLSFTLAESLQTGTTPRPGFPPLFFPLLLGLDIVNLGDGLVFVRPLFFPLLISSHCPTSSEATYFSFRSCFPRSAHGSRSRPFPT